MGHNPLDICAVQVKGVVQQNGTRPWQETALERSQWEVFLNVSALHTLNIHNRLCTCTVLIGFL